MLALALAIWNERRVACFQTCADFASFFSDALPQLYVRGFHICSVRLPGTPNPSAPPQTALHVSSVLKQYFQCPGVCPEGTALRQPFSTT